jgi:hypothetical protein
MAETDGDFVLGRYWQPDDYTESGEGVGRPLGCLATTYSFEAEYFERFLVPRFLGLEFDPVESGESFLVEREEKLSLTQVIVLVNAAHYDRRQASPRWLQLPVRVPGGVLHAKVTLLVWENLIRVILGSANLTRAGYRHNREVASALDFYDSSNALAPKSVLKDVLNFLKELRRSNWLRAGEKARARIDDVINTADRLCRSWKNLREEFGAREIPRLRFAATMPSASGRGVKSSPLKTVRSMWGSRTARKVTVLTPFVGEPPKSANKAIVALRKAFPRRNTQGCLAVPGGVHDGATWTSVPVSFWDAWKSCWGRRDKECNVWVVPPRRKDEDVSRPLHTKGLVVENDYSFLVMCGSSNFSVHGMGIGIANVEANLCYLDGKAKRGRLRLADRLGVDWEADRCDDARWPKDAPPAGEDGHVEETNLPPYFLSAHHDQVNGVLVIEVSLHDAPPPIWELSLPGSDGNREQDALLKSTEIEAPADGTLTLRRASLKGRHLTAVWILWKDPSGTPKEAQLPIQVEDAGAVSAEPTSAMLSAQGILECLAGDYEPARWISRRKKETRPKRSRNDERDAHNAVDTRAYLLYRTRQLGQAISVLGRRIFESPRSRMVLRYRLFDDLLGPLSLARALEKEWQLEAEQDAPARAAYLFALGELRLTAAHVYAAMPVRHRREFQSLFEEAIGSMSAFGQGLQSASPLEKYLESVSTECRRLLAGEGAI